MDDSLPIKPEHTTLPVQKRRIGWRSLKKVRVTSQQGMIFIDNARIWRQPKFFTKNRKSPLLVLDFHAPLRQCPWHKEQEQPNLFFVVFLFGYKAMNLSWLQIGDHCTCTGQMTFYQQEKWKGYFYQHHVLLKPVVRPISFHAAQREEEEGKDVFDEIVNSLDDYEMYTPPEPDPFKEIPELDLSYDDVIEKTRGDE